MLDTVGKLWKLKQSEKFQEMKKQEKLRNAVHTEPFFLKLRFNLALTSSFRIVETVPHLFNKISEQLL